MGKQIFAIIISIILVLGLYLFILPDSKRNTLNKFFKAIHDFLKIKKLMIESIFRFLYVFCVVFFIVDGIFTLFNSFGTGLLMIIFGPIVSRITFELLLMSVILVKNVMEINNHLKGVSTPEETSNLSAGEIFANVSKKIENITQTSDTEKSENTCTCPSCGKTLPEGNEFCIYCGTKLEK